MYKDRRFIKSEKWYYSAPRNANMRIPDNYLSGVAFLCVDVGTGKQPIGTGFFVQVPEHHGDYNFTYFVTAEHLLKDENGKDFTNLSLRMNTPTGFDYFPLQMDQWIRLKDKPIDLAMILVDLAPDDWAHGSLHIQDVFDNDLLMKHNIGIGDDVFTLGLFTLRRGRSRNIPIVRIGNIVSMPIEPLVDRQNIETFDQEYYAYLMEMRSIGGLSGAPVFVLIDINRTVDPCIPEPFHYKIGLIGLVRGHWLIDAKHNEQDFVSDAPDALAAPDGAKLYGKLNSGIALVTPSNYIKEILMHSKLAALRAKHIEAVERSQGEIVLDRAPMTDETFTELDFLGALNKASRRLSSPDAETKGTSELHRDDDCNETHTR